MSQSGSADSLLRASEDVLTAHLEGEAVLLHLDTKNYFRLNDTAAVIWKALESGTSRAELLDELSRMFEAEPTVTAAGLERLLEQLAVRGLLASND